MTTTVEPRQRRTYSGRITAIFGLTALTLVPAQVFGLGFRIPNQDAAAIARGNAFVATADNPSAIYYNPAGITQLEGLQAQVGVLNYFGINTFYDAPNGSDAQTDFENIPVPQLHVTYTPKGSSLSFGLGMYAPFGLGVKWPENSGFRSIAIESRLQYLTLNPVIAWKIHPTLSIAVGPTINYSEIKITRGLLTATDKFKFQGDDTSLGFNAGILWQPHSQWSFGANYRAASRMNYEGTSTYDLLSASANTKAAVDFPQIISAGVSFRPNTNWNIEFNVDYTDWNTLNTVTLDGTSALGINNVLPGPPPAFDLPLQLDWHESWFFEFGVTRNLDDGWFVSAGYFYSSETAPSSTYTPAIPDTALHVGSLGVGHQTDKWRWVVAGQLIAGGKRNITDSQTSPFTGESANGKYQLIVPTLSVSLSRKF
jgi:long-chain fatty acid transport protein